MIIPITPGAASSGGTPQAMPSEANLLMALAEMHKQGRFGKQQDTTNVLPMKKPA